MRTHISAVTLSAVTFGAALFLGAAAGAGESTQVGGRMTCKTPEQHSIPVEGDPGHVLAVQIETCVGSASGELARFDGGQQTWVEADDLFKGSGMIHGYETAKYKDGGTTLINYVGAQVATMIDGKPQWTALGTFEQANGTGSMANIHLRGTWTAKPISLDTLIEYDFDLSKKLGTILVVRQDFSDLPAIKTISSILFSSCSNLANLLNSSDLWLLYQRRHLFVHRRGIVDKIYLNNTSEAAPLGTALEVPPKDFEKHFSAVLKTGEALLRCFQNDNLTEAR